MKRVVRYVVVPFRVAHGRLQAGEPRSFGEEDLALRTAELLVARWSGAAAYEVHVDPETGEMYDPRELVVHGVVQPLDDEQAA